MPTAPTGPEQLRQRASALRLLASRLDLAPARRLALRAGNDVWLGPTASRCTEDLLDMQRTLLAAADELRTRARSLDSRAAQLAAVRLAAVSAGTG